MRLPDSLAAINFSNLEKRVDSCLALITQLIIVFLYDGADNRKNSHARGFS